MNLDNTLQKVLDNQSETESNWLSFDEKLGIISELVSNKVADILKKQIIISKTTNKKVHFDLPSKEIENSDNIDTFLKILWAKNISISWWWRDYTSDYTWWRDYFDVPTHVSFKI